MHLATVISRRRVASALALLVVIGLATFGVARATGDGERLTGCERSRADAAERRRLDTGSGPDVVVIGDSYAVGTGVDPLESWPVGLPGRVHVDGFGGSGFSATASPCGPVSYADRAARAVAGRPDALVVVEGGLNDHDQSDAAIQRGFARLMRELAGREVVVVGPAPAPSRATQVARVDAVLARMSVAFGATYVSVADADLDYLEDRLHPTPSGHRVLGDLVARELVDLGRQRPSGPP